MRVWLLKIGELPPLDGSNERLYRTGMLARALVDRGHDVTWWNSTLDHAHKKLLYQADTCVKLAPNYTLRLLHSITYTGNISAKRILNHIHVARKFRRLAEQEMKPDCIVCCLPTLEMCAAATAYGRRHGIPVVIDIRDLWPDIFLDVAPKRLRSVAKTVLAPYYRIARRALRGSTGIIGISDGYLNWGLRYANRERTARDVVFPLGYRRPSIAEETVAEAGAALVAQGVDASRLICWFVGMFGRTYDLDTVIEAARALQKAGLAEVQFVLSGSGENYDRLVADARDLHNVVFTGRVNGPALAWLARNAAIGLMAYAKGAPQSLPNKLFEYLCNGLPVLSSLEAETQTLLSEHGCGLTYSAGDAPSLAASVKFLAEDRELRHRMSANGADLFETRYSAEKIYPKIADYLEHLCYHVIDHSTAAINQPPWDLQETPPSVVVNKRQ